MIRAFIIAALVSYGAYHTITFDEVQGADSYRVYVSRSPRFERSQARVCSGSPCTIWIWRPAAGRVAYVSVVGVNDAGEGPR